MFRKKNDAPVATGEQAQAVVMDDPFSEQQLALEEEDRLVRGLWNERLRLGREKQAAIDDLNAEKVRFAAFVTPGARIPDEPFSAAEARLREKDAMVPQKEAEEAEHIRQHGPDAQLEAAVQAVNIRKLQLEAARWRQRHTDQILRPEVALLKALKAILLKRQADFLAAEATYPADGIHVVRAAGIRQPALPPGFLGMIDRELQILCEYDASLFTQEDPTRQLVEHARAMAADDPLATANALRQRAAEMARQAQAGGGFIGGVSPTPQQRR